VVERCFTVVGSGLPGSQAGWQADMLACTQSVSLLSLPFSSKKRDTQIMGPIRFLWDRLKVLKFKFPCLKDAATLFAMASSLTTLSIMTLNKMGLSITTIVIKTLIIMTLSIAIKIQT
jgi:hypothetical protein